MNVFRTVMILVLLFGVLLITVSAIAGPKDSFTLKTIDSYVTVFRQGDTSSPYMTTQIDERSLPETDRLLLSIGINVESEYELWSILEDLGS